MCVTLEVPESPSPSPPCPHTHCPLPSPPMLAASVWYGEKNKFSIAPPLSPPSPLGEEREEEEGGRQVPPLEGPPLSGVVLFFCRRGRREEVVMHAWCVPHPWFPLPPGGKEGKKKQMEEIEGDGMSLLSRCWGAACACGRV